MMTATAIEKRRRYSEYRPSGVEWLGEVPAHWEVKRVKNVATVNMGQSPSSEDCNQEGEGVPFLQGNADFGDLFPSPRHYCAVANKLAQIHDILFSVRAPVGAINVADQVYGIGRGLCAITPIGDNSQGYMLHGLEIIKKELFSVATGSTYEAVSVEQVGNARCLCPPPDEQRAIAAFLDRETARIDALISKKERQIELLQEKRTALISHVVTKGLKPNVKMKDSGIEWLGEVPSDWPVKRLRFCMRINPTKAETRSLDGSTLISFVPMEAVGEYGGLRLDQIKPIDEIATGYTYFQNGDVVIAKITPCFENGKGAIAEGLENGIGFGTTELHVLRPSAHLELRYLFYLTISYTFRNIGTAYMYGAGGQKRIPDDFVRDFRHPIPPIDIQCDIAAFIDRETARIDALIDHIRVSIEKLREYHTALISAAVTGKIDVRKEID